MDTSLFHKADRLFNSNSTSIIQNSLDNVDAGMPLAQDWPALLTDSTTGHYNSTGMHSASLSHSHKGKALEHVFVVLNEISTHSHT